MESIRVREAEAGDIPLLVTLMTEFYAESDYPLPAENAARAFGALLASPALGRVFLAECDGEAAGHGVLTFAFSMEYGGLRAFVDDLFVRPAQRGKGAGSALVAAMRRTCATLGVRALLVEAGPDNDRALHVYRKSGLADTGHLLMTLPLAPPVHAAGPTHEPAAADFESRYRASATAPASGEVRLIVVRRGGGVHDTPSRVELDREQGVRGDRWGEGESPNPEAQVSILDARVAAVLAGGDPARLSVPGDNLVVEMDVDEASLPVGTRLRAGTALLEITPKPHTGCAKFRERFGDAALRWVSEQRPQRRRGVYARVIEGGAIAVGDRVTREPTEAG
jgi:GNAT superfamily N-acetyltransferase